MTDRQGTAAEQVVNAMIAACCRKDIEAALACFTPDVRYHNIPLEPVFGREGVRATLEPFLAMALEVDWVIHHSVGDDRGLVMNERTDRFRMPSGWVELPVMGVFEVVNGKIAHWRDYFDREPLGGFAG